jgi:hypothetical protein
MELWLVFLTSVANKNEWKVCSYWQLHNTKNENIAREIQGSLGHDTVKSGWLLPVF